MAGKNLRSLCLQTPRKFRMIGPNHDQKVDTARGKGLGKQWMTPVTDAADRAGMPCYLENSNPANTGFYRSRVFERMKLFEPGPGAPPMEAMWREPRPVEDRGS